MFADQKLQVCKLESSSRQAGDLFLTSTTTEVSSWKPTSQTRPPCHGHPAWRGSQGDWVKVSHGTKIKVATTRTASVFYLCVCVKYGWKYETWDLLWFHHLSLSLFVPAFFLGGGLKDLVQESRNSCLQATESESTKVSQPCIKGGVLDAELLLDSEMDGMLGRKCLATAKGVKKRRNGVCGFFLFTL